MSLWDGKDKDVAFRNCFFQDDLCEGLPISPWYMVHIRRRQGRIQLFYKWESGMLGVEPGTTGILLLNMNGNVASLQSTVTALHGPVFG